ncbi:MAG: hypothetical protein QOD74_1217 [Variibacter sp.]|jgi:hypothetical protein|nr:hypothetical protein [Variibacter sp.]
MSRYNRVFKSLSVATMAAMLFCAAVQSAAARVEGPVAAAQNETIYAPASCGWETGSSTKFGPWSRCEREFHLR